mmetsp:Transcript_45605/g.105831  ORF Transcript_45605/g.105831 Transcript_45605/m.105831 type:complete len:1246 (-) Transcript_45605:265-4002(-)
MAYYNVDGGGAGVNVECSKGLGKSPLTVNIQVRNIHGKMNINSGGFGGRLHWAVLGDDGQWRPPTMQPDGSCECDAVASSARLNKDGNVTMRFPHGHIPEKIIFVVVIQVHGQTHWLKAEGNQDFVVNLKELAGESAFRDTAAERVAPRPAEWPELDRAKAALAAETAAASAATATPAAKPKLRRRRQPEPAAVAVASTNGKSPIKEGSSNLESGLGSITWTVVLTKENVSVFVEASMELLEEAKVYLHWGTAPSAGAEWELPKEALPNAKQVDGIASRTELEGQARADFRFRAMVAPQWLSFVIFVQIGADELWLKREDGSNFWIDALGTPDASVASAPSGGEKSQTVAQKFCAAETRYPNWTQFNRICMASDILAGNLGLEEASWVAADLCLANAKVLEWYRRSGYQPKDMAHAQERIGGAMAGAHSKATDPTVRTLLRLCVRAVPRGNSGGGDAIRHGILNIMRNHGIREGHRPGIECKFIEQWHQKLHTNSAPDDIAICCGYLAFLRSGNPDDMWRVIWEEGGLTREDLGKMCQQGFADHTKSGAKGLNFTPVHLPNMYNDMQNYLGLLKHVHGGSDLHSLCEACKGQYPDHGAECMAWEIYNRRDDGMVIGKILDMRRCLESCIGKRDILMLDVAMEDLLRALAERADLRAMGQDDLMNFLLVLLDDLLLSRKHNLSLQQGSDLLKRLVQGDHGGLQRWSPEWCKMVHAACDRLGLVCAGTADKVAELLQDCADKLQEAGAKPGAVFQPDSKALATFGEEKARCLTERLVAQALKILMPQLRRGAGLGPWEIVSQGEGGKALGTVDVLKELGPCDDKATAKTVAIVETMTGWEDIPAGITALLLPASQAVDTLSHVAIRARNQQVLLASCDDDGILEQLRAAKGSYVQVEITPNGVTWASSTAPANGAVGTSNAPKSVMQKITPPPEPPAVVIPVKDFVQNKRSLGGKSLHLAELQPKQGAYTIPASVTIPYRMFERMLKLPVNEGIEEELEEILQTNDLAEARKFVVDYLAVSEEIEQALVAALAAAGAPAPSGDWQRALKGVWASKWTDRAVSSRKQMCVADEVLFLAVLVQPIAPAAYAFVIHTKSPLPSAASDEQLIELCVGLGESLVSNSPGRALSASVSPQASTVHVFPSKPDGVFTPDGGTLIFRSDSNGEDLEGFAGAGLYDSITVTPCTHRTVSYADEPLMFDAGFREAMLRKLYDLGRLVEANFGGAPQDIEGAVLADGSLVVTQSRPQV